jgi:hypothetical protein
VTSIAFFLELLSTKYFLITLVCVESIYSNAEMIGKHQLFDRVVQVIILASQINYSISNTNTSLLYPLLSEYVYFFEHARKKYFGK